MRISAQKPREMGRQITQEKIWHKSEHVLHKSVVDMQ